MIGGNTSTAPRTGSGIIIGVTNPLEINGGTLRLGPYYLRRL
jgi:hypothetical protein